ncbi:hypothetical protein [Terriglobus aquaticus]|uniref:Uncharacterized protein n=1 Tax=Terriglobus aquaticus TaxID=940139 RepID=A0ABW9KIV4_9BACT|nr:hypothetical protein [Terriglobus aquaticus]
MPELNLRWVGVRLRPAQQVSEEARLQVQAPQGRLPLQVEVEERTRQMVAEGRDEHHADQAQLEAEGHAELLADRAAVEVEAAALPGVRLQLIH